MTLREVYNGKSIDEVLELLNQYGKEAKIIAGGTDVIISLRNSKISPKVLIDIAKIEELKRIEDDGEYITIGAGVTFTQIVESPLFQTNLHGFHKACRMVGSPQIRNKGTIGGNIANGGSAADGIPPLIALGSMITLLSPSGKREISLEDYYYNPIKEDELLTTIRFRKQKDNEVLSFAKLGLRKALAISRLTLSCFIEFAQCGKIKDVRVASGALGKYPMREPEVEAYLIGKYLNEATIEEATDTLKASMDVRLKGRSTLPYKRVAIYSILKEALEEAVEFKNEVNS